MIYSKLKPKSRLLLFVSVLMGGIISPVFVNANSGQEFNSRLDILEFNVQKLGDNLLGDNLLGNNLLGNNLLGLGDGLVPGLIPPVAIDAQPEIRVAQARISAGTNLRLAQLEEQMRILTGQVEGLQFQLTQIQMLIERMQEDNEFRFQQLEGGGSGKIEAATQSGGDRPSAELSQNQTLSAPIDAGVQEAGMQEAGVTENLLSSVDGSEQLPEAGFSPDNIPDAQIEDGFGDQVLEDQVLVEGAVASLQLPDQNRFSNQVSPSSQGLSGQGLNLNFENDSLATIGDANAQYKAGFDAVMEGDYQFAQDQFRQFIGLYPDHPQAPDAANWLGESLIIDKEYNEAAQVLFSGYEKYQNTTRAPDLLFKLGVALVGAGEEETACRTFGEVLKRYPDMGAAFLSQVQREMTQIQC